MKTGKQIFELILSELDRSVKVSEIVDGDTESTTFKVCDTKWMRDENVFTLNSTDYVIDSVNYLTRVVVAQIDVAEISVGDILQIQAPEFKSGTPRNLNGELKLQDGAEGLGLIVGTKFPIVWLYEGINGRRMDTLDYWGAEFDFTFYCLDEFNADDWLNDERHEYCIYPMTQLMDAIIEVMQNGNEFEMEGNADFREFSRFGAEDANGFRAYILDLNLSGIECGVTVKVDRDSCLC